MRTKNTKISEVIKSLTLAELCECGKDLHPDTFTAKFTDLINNDEKYQNYVKFIEKPLRETKVFIQQKIMSVKNKLVLTHIFHQRINGIIGESKTVIYIDPVNEKYVITRNQSKAMIGLTDNIAKAIEQLDELNNKKHEPVRSRLPGLIEIYKNEVRLKFIDVRVAISKKPDNIFEGFTSKHKRITINAIDDTGKRTPASSPTASYFHIAIENYLVLIGFDLVEKKMWMESNDELINKEMAYYNPHVSKYEEKLGQKSPKYDLTEKEVKSLINMMKNNIK